MKKNRREKIGCRELSKYIKTCPDGLGEKMKCQTVGCDGEGNYEYINSDNVRTILCRDCLLSRWRYHNDEQKQEILDDAHL